MNLGKKNHDSVFWSLYLSISLFIIILMVYISDKTILSVESMSEPRNRAVDSSNMA